MSEYTDQLTAEQLIQYIASDYVELSSDKAYNQRDWHMKICRDWLKKNYKYETTEQKSLNNDF
jgi:HD superfamily phosphohydrolase YqeK